MRIWVVSLLAALPIAVSILAFIFFGPISIVEPDTPQLSQDSCNTDSDCAPVQCCHPTSCTNVNYRPDCSDAVCTQVCQGPIDCGAGRCGCVSSKCRVVSN